jgi:hypothetical protein
MKQLAFSLIMMMLLFAACSKDKDNDPKVIVDPAYI